MEWIWYIIASLGAGIGTGLAGLSAATVMVPILIVLCPSFSGETGVYQATAIALASDILGSAVTTYTYAKNKNIDLKRGWIMLVCIISMCTVGSWVAFIVGNVVLGGFTLFLTFFIGIRFLVKPDSNRKNQVSKGEKLDLKGIIISIFFGLTIGFGTGFVGTGGGMMMLVVFTMFLGMELKTAVGTSTFIMTFTALIASVSHIIIHPVIVLEKWDVMLVCIVVATVSSLFTARFANRVKPRTVGLVTGGVLTVLGAVMLVLNYWDILSRSELIVDTFFCLKTLIKYLIPCVVVLIPIRFLTKIPSFVFRKLLHIVAFSCFTVMVLSTEHWGAAALCAVLIAVMIYPILSIFERESWYGKLFVEKSKGETKRSLLLLFFMFAAVIAVGWGLLNKPELVATSIMIWGPGDAAAALIGIPFGKHKIMFKPINGKKSWEGSLAMLLVSFLFGAGILLIVDYPIQEAALFAIVGAITGTIVEMLSPSEWDTVTTPVSVLAVLWAVSAII
ncbi:MAG: TSUP family transporter [Lachnospiraceae bacterium]|nr:TSUP family transporter [Lachnospiraceae bacterium]